MLTRQMENGHHTAPKSLKKVVSSSISEANVSLLGTDGLYDVNIGNVIDCPPCGLAFDDIPGLERHLVIFHKKTTRRFDLPTSQSTRLHTVKKCSVTNHDEPKLDEGHGQQNGLGPSSPQKQTDMKFKTSCTWCTKEFECEPVDAETMADASGFMCPKCKEKISGGLERSLSRCYQD